MNYLTLPDLLWIAERTLGQQPLVRDRGLLESAVDRPRSSAFGADAYPTLALKAAALTQSIARNHALVDGNKRLALTGLISFLGVNGHRLILSNDDAYDLIIEIATGKLDEIAAIAERIDQAIVAVR